MRLETRRLLEQLITPRQACIGAVFCSYTFDPAYFEEQVLRTLLALSSDPDEDGTRYHAEARAALRDTPVACFVDASVRQGGRRLPYDLHLVRKRTFHPKVTLVLYETEARVAVGSGNLTRPGHERNVELFFTRVLRYDDPVAVVMLRQLDAFFGACLSLAASDGTQLQAARQALAARIAGSPEPAASAPRDASFISTFESSALRSLAEALPAQATLRRVGVLSPFFERDDLAIADEREGLTSVLSELLALRRHPPGEAPALELGVPWEDAPLAPPAAAVLPALAPGLWAWRRARESLGGDEPVAQVAYIRVEKITGKQVFAVDAGERSQRLDRAEFEAALADHQLWPVAPPKVHAPARILQRVAKEHQLQLWLQPTATLAGDGRPLLRPLHAKLFLITVEHRGQTSTYALVGSANASRAALERPVAEGGNVEAGVLMRFDGEVRLRDLLPSLVASSLGDVQLEERPAPESELDLSAWIEDAVHDAEARTLTIVWASAGPKGLSAWQLSYLGRAVASGAGPATEPTLVTDFDLSPASAELALLASDRCWMIPIRVADLAQLPIQAGLPAPDLRALLAMLGRRVGSERLATLWQQRGPSGVAAILESLFGDGFGPHDVFKAWWGLRQEIEDSTTVASLRHRLVGPTGARTVWKRLCEVPETELARDEVWLYGSELMRELRQANLADGPDRPARAELLAALVTELCADLAQREPPGDAAWLDDVRAFYRGRGPRS